LNSRLPGGSYRMRVMRYVFADIVRAHHKTLWRIVVEAQVAPSFCTGAPKLEKLRFSTEIDGFLRANCWMQAEYFCQSWKCVRDSPKYGQKWSPQSTLTFSMKRQTLQKTFGLGRFLNGRLPGGSFCVRQMSHILTYIIQDHG